MATHLVKKIIQSLEQQWNIVETSLCSLNQYLQFNSYLNNYRGLSHGRLNSNLSKVNQTPVNQLLQFFVNLFILNGLADEEDEVIRKTLIEIEGHVNLLLYYWYGENDRNYQWRTWVHFLECEGHHASFMAKSNQYFFVTFSANGIYFGLEYKEESNRLPNMTPISKILPFYFQNDKDIFPRLRTLQREICLLIDEWEYQNSILAVEYGESLHQLNRFQNEEAEARHLLFLKKMDAKRNFYAQFTLESLCDFQEGFNQLFHQNKNSDILSEVDALCALNLSALQKILLPASMSRLVYKSEVISLFTRFMKARLVYCPEDYSASLSLQSAESTQGCSFNIDLFHILKSKPFEWKFCFDPSSFLKAFCWSYSKTHHLLLTSLMGLCYFKKCYSNILDEHKFSDFISTYEIQESFLSFIGQQDYFQNSQSIPQNVLNELAETLIKYCDSHLKKTEYNSQGIEFVKSYLGQFI